MRILVAGEAGYAPETPTGEAIELNETSDVGGVAWNIVVSLMDLRPDHSVGFNYGRTDAGWLLSPQYRANEELIEVRYLWKKSSRLTIEARLRVREELERLSTAGERGDETDGFVRLTWRFSKG